MGNSMENKTLFNVTTTQEKLSIKFNNKPLDEIRKDLKNHGWKWNFQQMQWERQNTEFGQQDVERFKALWGTESTIENENKQFSINNIANTLPEQIQDKLKTELIKALTDLNIYSDENLQNAMESQLSELDEFISVKKYEKILNNYKEIEYDKTQENVEPIKIEFDKLKPKQVLLAVEFNELYGNEKDFKIGRASCRERVCQVVYILGVAVVASETHMYK